LIGELIYGRYSSWNTLSAPHSPVCGTRIVSIEFWSATRNFVAPVAGSRPMTHAYACTHIPAAWVPITSKRSTSLADKLPTESLSTKFTVVLTLLDAPYPAIDDPHFLRRIATTLKKD
jgi:hypothetical protein